MASILQIQSDIASLKKRVESLERVFFAQGEPAQPVVVEPEPAAEPEPRRRKN